MGETYLRLVLVGGEGLQLLSAPAAELRCLTVAFREQRSPDLWCLLISVVSVYAQHGQFKAAELGGGCCTGLWVQATAAPHWAGNPACCLHSSPVLPGDRGRSCQAVSCPEIIDVPLGTARLQQTWPLDRGCLNGTCYKTEKKS